MTDPTPPSSYTTVSSAATPQSASPEQKGFWETTASTVANIAVSSLVSNVSSNAAWSVIDLVVPSKRAEKKKTLQEATAALLKDLTELGIDPQIFDVLVSNEIDRRMKVRFGITFLVFTFLFTLASYSIVVLDAVYQWGISPVAITALIIEIPIQFVGLLYIIARNLFPAAPPKGLTRRCS